MLASRRVYVHLCRWTSRGLSLLEAMYMGMPVVALSASEAPEALAGSAAIVSKDISGLQQGILDYLLDPLAAADAGRRNRAHVGSRFSLPRFHADWDRLLKEALA
jgi:glycosyltransferase involved in cell wall biosynthesis